MRGPIHLALEGGKGPHSENGDHSQGPAQGRQAPGERPKPGWRALGKVSDVSH